jgi:hypothetical protein
MLANQSMTVYQSRAGVRSSADVTSEADLARLFIVEYRCERFKRGGFSDRKSAIHHSQRTQQPEGPEATPHHRRVDIIR